MLDHLQQGTERPGAWGWLPGPLSPALDAVTGEAVEAVNQHQYMEAADPTFPSIGHCADKPLSAHCSTGLGYTLVLKDTELS